MGGTPQCMETSACRSQELGLNDIKWQITGQNLSLYFCYFSSTGSNELNYRVLFMRLKPEAFAE
jgi:hypothetical protein